MVTEEIDTYRRLTITITAWVYHKDDLETIIEPFTNTYIEEEGGPFTNLRNQWIYDKLEIIISNLTGVAIVLFKRYSMTAPANGDQNSASFNWTYKIISQDFEYTEGKVIPKIPEFVLRTIEDLERRKDEAKTEEKRKAIQKTIDRLELEYAIE